MSRPRTLSGTSTSERGNRPILVGSRRSGLALRQTEEVLGLLRAAHGPRVEFQVVTIETRGDVESEAPLVGLGKGIFIKEIERALLEGKLDMAVHSLKDMPTVLLDGLAIGAVCQRLDPRDVLVDRWGCSLDHLPAGARIGTSSPRRVAQLKALRKDLRVLPIRGNVDTRLRKAKGEDYDGAVLAAAGVLRMGAEGEIAEYLSPQHFVPAPGQGALAVEVRKDDDGMADFLACIEHIPTRLAITAERAFLEALGGGCQLPAGAYARTEVETMELALFLASPDGDTVFKTVVRGAAGNPSELALDGYQRLIEAGAGVLLK